MSQILPSEGDMLPHFNMDIMKMMHNLGYLLLKDDGHDIGYFSYTNRRVYYGGNMKTSHPSRWHHWIWGASLMTLAQVGGVCVKMREFMQTNDPDFDQEEMQNMQLPEEIEQMYQQESRLYGRGDNVYMKSTTLQARLPAQQMLKPQQRKLIPIKHRVISESPALPSPNHIVVPKAPMLFK